MKMGLYESLTQSLKESFNDDLADVDVVDYDKDSNTAHVNLSINFIAGDRNELKSHPLIKTKRSGDTSIVLFINGVDIKIYDITSDDHEDHIPAPTHATEPDFEVVHREVIGYKFDIESYHVISSDISSFHSDEIYSIADDQNGGQWYKSVPADTTKFIQDILMDNEVIKSAIENTHDK